MTEPVGCLVDTNVISELARREPNPGVIAWAGGVTRLAISVITVVTRNTKDFEQCGIGLLNPFTTLSDARY